MKNLKKEIAFVIGAVSLLAWSAQAAPQSSNWGKGQPSWATPPAPSTQSAASSGASRRNYSAREYESKSLVSPFSPDSHNVSLDVGQVFLMGDLGNRYNDSIGTRLHYTYGVSDIFGFDSSLGYSSHSEGKLSMTSLLTGLRTNLTWYDKVIPHGVVGLGFYKPSYTFPDLTSESQIVFGMYLGAGATLVMNDQFFFGASLTFHDIFGTRSESERRGTMEIDGTFTSFLLSAGMSF